MLKRLVKLSVAFLWRGGHLIAGIVKPTEYRCKKRLTVLTYHGVKGNDRIAFELQMRQLPRYGKPVPVDVSLDEMEAGNYIAVTFDDGYVDLLENALPFLKAEGIPATVFLTTGYMGKIADWSMEGINNRQQKLIMDEEQVRSVGRNDINFGSHGLTHRDLTNLDESSVYFELVESRRKLENCLGRSIDLFAFPFGAYDDRSVQMALTAGYRLVFRNIPSPNNVDKGHFLRGRISIEPNDWPLEYRLKMFGAYDWLPHAVTLKKNIIRVLRRLVGNPQTTRPV